MALATPLAKRPGRARSTLDEVRGLYSRRLHDQVPACSPCSARATTVASGSASFVSNIGLWIQTIALGWLVYDMTRSASWLGLIGFAGNLPMLVLGLVGGAIADRASRRAIMLGAQAALGVAALVLALLTLSGHVTVLWVIADRHGRRRRRARSTRRPCSRSCRASSPPASS